MRFDGCISADDVSAGTSGFGTDGDAATDSTVRRRPGGKAVFADRFSEERTSSSPPLSGAPTASRSATESGDGVHFIARLPRSAVVERNAKIFRSWLS
ncbi:hypothetical protein [Haladaptatus sp. DYF46]|uniref:hypothetical protein n=1 Tax=Haladaptatus sp. DYF46 TaxID=2886041 RepID=UPI001E60BF9D|nr:hypothetical protein [Haladaptatus sp. DYF46]